MAYSSSSLYYRKYIYVSNVHNLELYFLLQGDLCSYEHLLVVEPCGKAANFKGNGDSRYYIAAKLS